MFKILIPLIALFCIANPGTAPLSGKPSTPSTAPPSGKPSTPVTTPPVNFVDTTELDKFLHDHTLTCQEAFLVISQWEYRNFSRQLDFINTSNFINTNKTNGVCRFPMIATDLVLKNLIAPSWVSPISKVPWFCKIDHNQYCNEMSQCLTDECGCTNSKENAIFFCPKRTGCIHFQQLCDGNNDCLDGADECFCEGFVEVKYPILSSSSICLSQKEYCKRKDTISELNYSCTFHNTEDINCSATSDNENHIINPIDRCINNDIVEIIYYTNGNISSYCKTNCTETSEFSDGKWDKFCDRIVLKSMGMLNQASFTCTPVYYKETCPISKLCDGKVDCSNGADEA